MLSGGKTGERGKFNRHSTNELTNLIHISWLKCLSLLLSSVLSLPCSWLDKCQSLRENLHVRPQGGVTLRLQSVGTGSLQAAETSRVMLWNTGIHTWGSANGSRIFYLVSWSESTWDRRRSSQSHNICTTEGFINERTGKWIIEKKKKTKKYLIWSQFLCLMFNCLTPFYLLLSLLYLDLLDRPVENLLMNQANRFREFQEQRECLNQVMPLIHSGYVWYTLVYCAFISQMHIIVSNTLNLF